MSRPRRPAPPPDEAEIHPADPKVRRGTAIIFALLVASAVAGAVLLDRHGPALVDRIGDWMFGEPESAILRIKIVLGSLVLLVVAPFLVAAALCWRWGQRIVREERFPPSGARVLRDTVVLRGRRARSKGRLLQGMALFAVAVPPWIIVPSWQLVSRLGDAQARCFARRNELHAEIQRDWQNEVRAMVTAARPDLATLAEAEGDLQILLVDQREVRVAHLLDTETDRVPKYEGLSAFVNAADDWSSDDEAAFRESRPDAPSLQARIDSLGVSVRSHPYRSELRALVREDSGGLEGLRAARDAYEARLAQLAHDLETCGLVDIRERLNEPERATESAGVS